MGRSKLEVADIFRAHGGAYRREQTGHLNLPQLKVMSAVENCRTAALGGHVAACTKCDHQHIAYNSCRNYYPAGDCTAICREGGIAQNARALRRRAGCRRAWKTCCQSNTST
jgi:hypothetical protein